MDTRPRTRARRSYEDFVPSTELVQERDSDTLLVELSGFTKEQVRVQFDKSGNLKIDGERPLGGNKWARFCKDFQVVSNCNTNEIHATFDDGILFVTMPKFEVESGNKRATETEPEPTWNPPPSPPPPPPPPPPPETERGWDYFFPPLAPLEAESEPKSTPQAQLDQLDYSKQKIPKEDEKMKNGSIENKENLTRRRAGSSLEEMKYRSRKFVNSIGLMNEATRKSAGSMVVVVILVVLAVGFSVNYLPSTP